jgi:PAS domain S-box-containing protein
MSDERASWEQLVEVLPYNVYVFDLDEQRTEFLNRKVAVDLGYSAREIEAMGDQWLLALLHPDDVARMPALLSRWNTVADGEVVETEYRLRAPDGSWRWFLGRDVVYRRDERGAVRQILGTTLDIHRRKELEQRLAKAQQLEALGRMARGISHDFNNLLTVINVNVDRARRAHSQSKSPLEALADIDQVVQRAAELTRQLMAFARGQSMRPERVELRAVVEKNLSLLRGLVGEEIRLALETAVEAPLMIRIDPSQLTQALANLAINARDAMPSGGSLTIELSSDWRDARAWAVLSVEDTGEGMPPAVLSRIFEPFFSTKPADRGTGLGLSMVYGFITQSGGVIDVRSEVGRGTRFELRVPLEE